MSKQIRGLICAILMLWSTSGHSESLFGTPVSIGMHIGTVHIPSYELNGFNPGVYVRTDKNFLAGAYYNSYRRPTVYVAWQSPELLRTSLVGGVATGYKQGEVLQIGMGLSALGGLSLRLFNANSATGRLLYIPRLQPGGIELYHFTLEWSFK